MSDVSYLLLTYSVQLACATKRGFAVIEYDNGGQPKLNYLARPLKDNPRREQAQRFNDGACDVKGRFFAGTLVSHDPPFNGQLWCYDPVIGEAKLVDDDVTVGTTRRDLPRTN